MESDKIYDLRGILLYLYKVFQKCRMFDFL